MKTLCSTKDTIEVVAALFEKSSVCVLTVCEDIAFSAPKNLSLGDVTLFTAGTKFDDFVHAVKYGSFEWETPKAAQFTSQITKLLAAPATGDAKARADDKIRRIVDSFGAIPARLGLCHPIFDPQALESMPFKRPTTVVSDTSGVLQGGLSFVARYLHPAARVKVPAVVQMEIVNLADRFLGNRRSTKPKAIDLLMDHTMSQAGQRVLLQLELHSDVEIERTFLLGDPLRGAFQREEDKELRELNLNIPIRAYADRLILEAVRQHQSQVSHGHPVTLLTSDQGLARMAIAEGVRPLYFHSAKAKTFLDRTLTGTSFNPFSGALHTTSIVDVLWELATVFGSAKLATKDGKHKLGVYAIGAELAWAPYHSQDDLLWVETPTNLRATRDMPKSEEKPRPIGTTGAVERKQGKAPRLESPAKKPVPSEAEASASPQMSLYKFSAEKLIALIAALDNEQKLARQDVLKILGIRSLSGLLDYRRFLESAKLVEITPEQTWIAKKTLRPIVVALRNADMAAFKNALQVVPVFVALEKHFENYGVGRAFRSDEFARATSTYFALAELTGIGADIHGVGFFATPSDPSVEEFARMASHAYETSEKDGGWVATGRWLEQLISQFGVHPVVARDRLQEASEQALLKRTTEGSTTETKYDRHTLRMLSSKDGSPTIKTEHLYRGDFLLPGKASSSLRIEKS